MKEKWKRYRDTDYEVSNLGKVRNIKTQKILKTQKKEGKKHDYMGVTLRMEGKRQRKRVHRLVLEAFVGESEKEVDHINGIRDDNRLENLEYVTKEENYQRYLKKDNRSKRKPVRGINIDTGKIIEFSSLWQAGKFLKSNATIERKRGVNGYCNSIKANINKKSHYAYGYVWSFVEEGEVNA